jgi:polysaccharide deacetylase 2 family uncharacterized protein YibQ
MPANDLNNPFHRRAQARRGRRLPIAPLLIGVAAIIGVVSLSWVAIVDDPGGGRAVAIAKIQSAEPAATGSLAETSEAAPILVEQQPLEQVAALPFVALPESAAPGLIEQSAFGPLPRVSPDGRRPREAYAGRAPAAPADIPRIVVVVGGLGLSQTGTQSAIEELPESVTLAFAPYGGSLQRWVDKARAEGHEVLLQIPMEPLGYPQEDPGEHTLLVSADQRVREQDLNWSLSRMTSYAGVMNHLGARFTGDERALVAFLSEVGRRGLFYVDDGSSPNSLAPRVGDALKVPVVAGDIVLDRDRDPESIRRELAALEAIARTRGAAIGVASAFPESINTIAEWAEEAETEGVIVVPASAVLPQ